MTDDGPVYVRYMVDDVADATAFYVDHLGFTLGMDAIPAFAEVTRGALHLLLSGPKSSAARPMSDGAQPGPGGWNRIHLLVDDLDAEVSRLTTAGVTLRSDPVRGPGGKQALVVDPSGNVVELFQSSRSAE